MDNNQQQYHIVFTGAAKSLRHTLHSKRIEATLLAASSTGDNKEEINASLYQQARQLYLDEIVKVVKKPDEIGRIVVKKVLLETEDWYPEITVHQIHHAH